MRLLGFIVAACLALAVLKAVAAVIVLALIGALVLGVAFRPLQTFGFVVGMVLLSAFERHPLVGLTLITIAVITKALAGNLRAP